jgi:hypothetical protein
MLTIDKKIIPIYSSRGDAEVFLQYPPLYNRLGEWVGVVTPLKEVYSVLGFYVGYISKDQRILRDRFLRNLKPNIQPPQPPVRVMPPATIPLAPLMSELMYSTIDVLLEEPERLHALDTGDLREDLD